MLHFGALLVLGLLLSACMINGIASKEEIAEDRIGRDIFSELDFIKEAPKAGGKVVYEKSYKMPNGDCVIAIDDCYAKCVPWSPYYDCIIYHEVDEHGIIVNAWPDPNSWKERPREERGTIHDTADPEACTPKALLGPFYDR